MSPPRKVPPATREHLRQSLIVSPVNGSRGIEGLLPEWSTPLWLVLGQQAKDQLAFSPHARPSAAEVEIMKSCIPICLGNADARPDTPRPELADSYKRKEFTAQDQF
jgi:hypothetical protein